MSDEALDRLTERLDRLERASCRWKLVSAASAAVLAFAVLGGAAPPRSEQRGQEAGPALSGHQVINEIRAKRVMIVDDAGRPRAVLGAAAPGAVSLGMLDNNDKIRSVLIVDADGTPRLELLGSDETRRLVLGVFPTRSGLGLFGDAGRGGAILDVAADGTASLGLTDKKERTRAGLLLRADGTVFLNLNDTSEKVRAALGVGTDDAPGLGMWDSNGKRIWQAPPAERTP